MLSVEFRDSSDSRVQQSVNDASLRSTSTSTTSTSTTFTSRWAAVQYPPGRGPVSALCTTYHYFANSFPVFVTMSKQSNSPPVLFTVLLYTCTLHRIKIWNDHIPVVKVVLWSRGAHLTKPGWSKRHTLSNPTNLALFRHNITLYRFNQGAHTIAGGGGSNGSRGGWASLTLTTAHTTSTS